MRPAFPPSLGMKLLVAFAPERTKEALCGDLIEEYRRRRSRVWFWRQVAVALVLSATHEAGSKKLYTIRALLLGYVVATGLCYFTTSLVALFVSGYKAYVVLLPFVFFSAAASGWAVQRSHGKPMVLVFAAFCIAISIASFAAYAWLPIYPRYPTAANLREIPIPVLAFFAASDFVVGPIGVLLGGLLGSPGGNSSSRSLVC
jgi:hypothetical protein